ncbi:MAG: hypothetical protein ACXVYY_00945 [Oryzihumus sp.]
MSLVKIDDTGTILLIAPVPELPVVSMKVGDAEPLRLQVHEAKALSAALEHAATLALTQQ